MSIDEGSPIKALTVYQASLDDEFNIDPSDETSDRDPSKSSSSCSSNLYSGSVRKSIETLPTMSIDASSICYTKMRIFLLDSHLTCQKFILALFATNLSSIPRPKWYQRRKERWEKNDAKLPKKKWTNSSTLTSSEVRYSTWLANVVMVKKANDKWRMCIDYDDLNRACPKYAYPLPSIDRLINGAFRF